MGTEKTEVEGLIEGTSETIAKDLLSVFMQEIRLLPDAWPALKRFEQDNIIDRVRNRVIQQVRHAVALIAAEDRVTVVADLKKVTFGDEIQAVFIVGARDPARLDLADSRGKACLIVVTDAGAHTAGVDEVRGEDEQRSFAGMGEAKSVIDKAKRPPKDDASPARLD